MLEARDEWHASRLGAGAGVEEDAAGGVGGARVFAERNRGASYRRTSANDEDA